MYSVEFFNYNNFCNDEKGYCIPLYYMSQVPRREKATRSQTLLNNKNLKKSGLKKKKKTRKVKYEITEKLLYILQYSCHTEEHFHLIYIS